MKSRGSSFSQTQQRLGCLHTQSMYVDEEIQTKIVPDFPDLDHSSPLAPSVREYRTSDENTDNQRHRGSDKSAHVLLNLLNQLRKRDKMQGLSSI